MKKIVLKTVCVFICALFITTSLTLSVFADEVKKDKPTRLSVLIFSAIRQNEDGFWERLKYSTEQAHIGQKDHLAARVIASHEDIGQTFKIQITSDALDFTDAKLMLLVEAGSEIVARELDVVIKDNKVYSELTIDSIIANPNLRTYLYIEGTRTLQQGKAKAVLYKKGKSFADGPMEVNGYIITKQGNGFAPIDKIAGIGGINEKDIVYIFSKENQEIVRSIIQDNAVLGIVKKAGDIVVALEYSFSKGGYVSMLSGGKVLLEKETLLDVLNDLQFSFLNAPDESRWFSDDGYASVRTLMLH